MTEPNVKIVLDTSSVNNEPNYSLGRVDAQEKETKDAISSPKSIEGSLSVEDNLVEDGETKLNCAICLKQTDLFSIFKCVFCKTSCCSSCSHSVEFEGETAFACLRCDKPRAIQGEPVKQKRKRKNRNWQMILEGQHKEPMQLRQKTQFITEQKMLEYELSSERSKCHNCGKDNLSFSFICLNDLCSLTFCKPCIRKYCSGEAELVELTMQYEGGGHWVCPVCEGRCQCNKCNKVKKKYQPKTVRQSFLVQPKKEYRLPRKKKASREIEDFAVSPNMLSSLKTLNCGQTQFFESPAENLPQEQIQATYKPVELLSKKRMAPLETVGTAKSCNFCSKKFPSSISFISFKNQHSFINEIKTFFYKNTIDSLNYLSNRELFDQNYEFYMRICSRDDYRPKICCFCMTSFLTANETRFLKFIFSVLNNKKSPAITKEVTEIMETSCISSEKEDNPAEEAFDFISENLDLTDFDQNNAKYFAKLSASAFFNQFHSDIAAPRSNLLWFLDEIKAKKFISQVNSPDMLEFNRIISEVAYSENILLYLKWHIFMLIQRLMRQNFSVVMDKVVYLIQSCLSLDDLSGMSQCSSNLNGLVNLLHELKRLTADFLDTLDNPTKGKEIETALVRIFSLSRNDKHNNKKYALRQPIPGVTQSLGQFQMVANGMYGSYMQMPNDLSARFWSGVPGNYNRHMGQ